MILPGGGCRLQTCRGLAAQWFDFTLRTFIRGLNVSGLVLFVSIIQRLGLSGLFIGEIRAALIKLVDILVYRLAENYYVRISALLLFKKCKSFYHDAFLFHLGFNRVWQRHPYNVETLLLYVEQPMLKCVKCVKNMIQINQVVIEKSCYTTIQWVMATRFCFSNI